MLDTKALAEATAIIVREHVEKATSPLLDRIAALEARQLERGEKGADGEPGRDGLDGKDADPQLIARMVADAIAALPVPADGKDGRDGKDGIDGKDGEKGADGAGIAELLIDRGGVLVATFTDGRMKTLGPVVGKDGQPGQPGKDGADGRDGFALDDFDVSMMEDGRTIELSFERGDVRNEFELKFPVVIDRGVWKEGSKYEQGDAVTWGGSLWIAQKETEAKPDSGDGWRLSVKRGRDGKDKV